jgi:hypothetical protein
MRKKNILNTRLIWTQHSENHKFFQTKYNGKKVLLRLNNFPEEPLYTIFGETSFDLDDKPTLWTLHYIDNSSVNTKYLP